MRAAAWNTANTLDLAERPAPELAMGEVLIRTGTAAIRGSGLHFYPGEFGGLPGMVPGHEISGVVEAGGALEPGTAVAVQPTVACRSWPPVSRHTGARSERPRRRSGRKSKDSAVSYES